MSEAVVCPYCRMPFDETSPPKTYCTACGVPHHEDCYQENGGCTVFGCSRAPADDPKLQVSYSDLNAAAAASGQAAYPVQAQPAAAMNPAPLRYGTGPLGLSQPAPAAPTLSPSAAVPSLPDYVQQAYAQSRQPKSRSTYIVLGIFLGALGIHNFYAGYVGRAVAQLCLSVLTLFYLALVSWIWAIVEICIVEKDSAGIRFS
jgi:TM2 domain-containing membrane protein YozV